jgi:hypothetical protein
MEDKSLRHRLAPREQHKLEAIPDKRDVTNASCRKHRPHQSCAFKVTKLPNHVPSPASDLLKKPTKINHAYSSGDF